MNNYVEEINKIVKSYFDQIEETTISKNTKMLDTSITTKEVKNEERIKTLELELETLRVKMTTVIKEFEEKKEREIEEYISKFIDSGSSFYAKYGSIVRKDLEHEYDKKLEIIINDFERQEQQLIEEIESLKKEGIDENQEKQNSNFEFCEFDFSKLELQKLNELLEKLFDENNRLKQKQGVLKDDQIIYEETQIELHRQKSRFDEIMNKRLVFKFEYNDQNQVINSNEWRNLYEESTSISEKISYLTNILSEKNSVIEEIKNINEAIKMLEEYLYIIDLTKKEKAMINADMITREDPVISKFEIEDSKIVVDTMNDLIKVIFNDVIDVALNMSSIRLNPSYENLGQDEYYISFKEDKEAEYKEAGTISLYSTDGNIMQLPNGEYLNYADFNEALENYYIKDKGQIYFVRQSEQEYNITKGTIVKFKNSLKHCSALKLVKDEKISKFDVTRIHGKPKTEKLFRANDIGTIYGKESMPEGDYVNRNELIRNLKNLLSVKLNGLNTNPNQSIGTEEKKQKRNR